jgi:hypothetical protein
MQREKAAPFWCDDAVEALEEALVWVALEPTRATSLVGEPLQPAASTATPTAAAIAEVRAVGGLAGCRRRPARMPSFVATTRSGGSLLRQCHRIERFRLGRERGEAGAHICRTWCPFAAYPG